MLDKPLGGKQTLQKSPAIQAEHARIDQLWKDIQEIIPIDSAEKAAKYRTALEKCYQKKFKYDHN